MRRLASALWLLWALPATAGQVSRAEVTHDAGTYRLLLDVELDADLAPVYAIATDFDRLYRISPTVTESARLPPPGPGLERRRRTRSSSGTRSSPPSSRQKATSIPGAPSGR
jgi:hypothetical protein